MLYEQRDHKWVYSFAEGGAAMKSLLGGKGANVAEMSQAGLPVPPGFTITTEACRAYIDYERQFPEGMWSQSQAALEQVETEAGKQFGSAADPLLVSVRSGAAISMPGMMDTVLNLGLNDETVEGLARLSDNRRFALDAYRRFISMFGAIVMAVPAEKFDRVLERFKAQTAGGRDTDLTVEQLEDVIATYKRIIFADRHGDEFPQDPYEQLRMAIAAVFDSWNGRRAIDYRRVHRISGDLGTAVNVQAMVFGNLDWDSGTGVAFTRNPSTGENTLFGEYLLNAQGEDVVAGIRTPQSISRLSEDLPGVFEQLQTITTRLERHYGDMQDIEFTIEDGKLWLLQTRDGKRTAQAAVRIAVDMADEDLITRKEAVRRIEPSQIDFFLHPQLDPDARRLATEEGRRCAQGLNVSPGAAVGVVAFDPDLAQQWAGDGREVILVRPETKPDDVHGMLAAEGILTTRGGRTSHAALVARQFGKPAVVGVSALDIDLVGRVASVGDLVIEEGDWLSLDGSTGEVYVGRLDTFVPDLTDPSLSTLLRWADEFRRLGVRANADYPADAERARAYGAEGIGLCRTEHMFFQTERLPIMQRMIMSDSVAMRRAALDELLPLQRADFCGLFRAMDGQPVIIRLVDPPLHEFLPSYEELSERITDAKIQLSSAGSLDRVDELLRRLRDDEDLRRRVDALREANPMLGLRGVRLAILYPEILQMQVRAIISAACDAAEADGDPRPEIMVPLTCDAAEMARVRELIDAEARTVLDERGTDLTYTVGTMIETPRAALTAGRLATHAAFFSFGTNDLTQMAFAISRDDAETGFLIDYLRLGVLAHNPFTSLDTDGVGQLIDLALTAARRTDPAFEAGICGEHGGDPASIAWCHEHDLSYVSCSPFRVPVARLAAAQAALASES